MHYGAEMNALDFGVKGQGHDGITYVRNSTLRAEAYSILDSAVELRVSCCLFSDSVFVRGL